MPHATLEHTTVHSPTCPKCGKAPAVADDRYCTTCEAEYQKERREEGLALIESLQAYIDRQPDDADHLSEPLRELAELKAIWGVK